MGEQARNFEAPVLLCRNSTPSGRDVLPPRRVLLGLLREAFSQMSGANCIRIEAPVPVVNARAWLAAQDAAVKTYWRSRDGSFETAAVGAADTVFSPGAAEPPDFGAIFAEMRSRLSCVHPDMRYYGGWAFDCAAAADVDWAVFGRYRFVLPRFELYIKRGRATFACNACRADAGRLDAIGVELDALKPAVANCPLDPPISRPPLVAARENLPARRDWNGLVEQALEKICAGDFEKVVLARQVKLRFAAPPDVSSLLEGLGKNAENAYLFAFQPCENTGFIGATPERLYQSLGGYIKTEAVAGTRPRGKSPALDARLGQDLMHSAKELREHAIVADRLRSVLDRICSDVRNGDDLSLVRMYRCQHLVRRFEGLLARGRADWAVLAALHPTPAVGGHPDGPALQWLRENEPFARGWYAGPVGWVGHDASEFAMAIRSGLVSGKGLTLYSGAGIVAGSTPDAEWEETESKLAAFFNVLTYNDAIV